MTHLFESAADQVDLFSVPLELGDELFGPYEEEWDGEGRENVPFVSSTGWVETNEWMVDLEGERSSRRLWMEV